MCILVRRAGIDELSLALGASADFSAPVFVRVSFSATARLPMRSQSAEATELRPSSDLTRRVLNSSKLSDTRTTSIPFFQPRLCTPHLSIPADHRKHSPMQVERRLEL